jgi:serine/threonine protein kinase
VSSREFGNYRLEERIAVGGMAELYRATLQGDEGFERPVAIKCILPELAQDAELVRMFIDEAKIAVRLAHPNVAEVLDLGQANGSYFIAQEYVHGRDLREIHEREKQRGHRIPLPIALHVVMQACEGLQHAHSVEGPGGAEAGVIHRDVSLQNILLSFEGEVKLVDFGLAKAAGRASQTQAGTVKGKLAYMSPEQAHGGDLDHRSDLYSLGVCLFELLTGYNPLLRESDVQTALAAQQGEIPPLSEVESSLPRHLETVLARALAPAPEDRYASAMQMHDDLEVHAFTTGEHLSRVELACYLHELFPEDVSSYASNTEPPGPDTIPSDGHEVAVPSASGAGQDARGSVKADPDATRTEGR